MDCDSKFENYLNKKTLAEKIATVNFAIFLVWVFVYSYFYPFNHDILLIKNSNFIINYGSMSHALPVLGVLIYKILPTKVVVWLSPFAIVAVYLLLYFLVSKKIVYWFPVTIPIPLYYSTLVPSVIDWILLPFIYDRLKKGRERQAIAISVIMVIIHGPFAFAYLPILFLFLNKKAEFLWVAVYSLPQLVPLMYFSQGYTAYVREYFFNFYLFGHYIITMSYYYWRIFVFLNYSTILLILMWQENRKIPLFNKNSF